MVSYLISKFTVVVPSVSHAHLCDPMDHNAPGLPVLHRLLELAQTHVHRVGDAIQPCLSLSSPSPPALILSQQKGLFWCLSRQRTRLQHRRLGDVGSITGSRRSPGEGNGNPLQYPGLKKIPWTEEAGGLQSRGLQRVGCD